MTQVFALLLLSWLTAYESTESTNTPQVTEISNSKISTMNKKETALAFVQAVTHQDADKVRALANADYIQHNPFLPTGLEPFIGLFPILKENGTKAKAIRVIEEGNFVVLHHLWTGAKPFGAEEMVSFDVLRFDDQGKIAEHWDALMPNTPPNPSGRTLIDGPTTIEDLEATEANKKLVKNLVQDVLFGNNPGKITDYISTETYHQHNPAIKDGLQGLQEAFQYLAANNDMFQYKKLHQVIGEGNFILTISEGEWHGKGHAFYDLFRVQDGKLVEHWDIIQEIPTENLANDNGMFGF
ncbi:MAG: nuclear transport factor 2 family protein [Bacteroidota bacterium]